MEADDDVPGALRSYLDAAAEHSAEILPRDAGVGEIVRVQDVR